jgi:hypothetical protein
VGTDQRPRQKLFRLLPKPAHGSKAKQNQLEKRYGILLCLTAIFAATHAEAFATTCTGAFVMSFVQHPADFFIGSASLHR